MVSAGDFVHIIRHNDELFIWQHEVEVSLGPVETACTSYLVGRDVPLGCLMLHRW